MMVAVLLYSRSISTAALTFSSDIFPVRLSIMVPACSTWFTKNSPKFFTYIFAFEPSTTATALLSTTLSPRSAFLMAPTTSESFPTPEGSIMILSGVYFESTSFKDSPKSPTSEQQIHPEFISLISIPDSFKKPPSIPISPNSFSMSTTCSPLYASFKSLLISVVFPAPRNPDTTSILVILVHLPFLCIDIKPG